jgi:hypothetical protein
LAVAEETRLVTLRERLASARLQGVDFSVAWGAARAELLEGLPWHERELWTGALHATAWAWESAYERRASTRLDWAVAELAGHALLEPELPLSYEPVA